MTNTLTLMTHYFFPLTLLQNNHALKLIFNKKETQLKTLFLVSLISFSTILSAQTFRGVPSRLPFWGVPIQALATGDLNGDTYLDIVILGDDLPPFAQLYISDEYGNFSEVDNTPFDGVRNGAVKIYDLNGDGHEDVLISGEDSSDNPITKLYTNDGSGIFTEAMGTPFVGVFESKLLIEDFNNDNHPDILISGGTNPTTKVTKLYTNDGSGNFTEVMGTPFVGVTTGAAVVAGDINGDTYPDVFLTGLDESFNNTVHLYTNDGSGNFTEVMGTPFDSVIYSAAAIADLNGDNHADLLLTGDNDTEFITKLYTNDGTGTFTEVTGTIFEPVYSSTVSIADLNEDGNPDVLITGMDNDFNQTTKLYTNDGSGNFTEATGLPFLPVSEGAIAIKDVNADNRPDVLITGYLPIGSGYVAELYTNQGGGNFSKPVFENIYFGSLSIADLNGDGHNDVLLTGEDNFLNFNAKLYTNDGSGNFTEVMGTPFPANEGGATAIADLNGDTYPDVLMTGSIDPVNKIAKLYTNDGSGNFTEVMGTPFEAVTLSTVSIADLNGDTYPDVLITGEDFNESLVSKLYTNDGSGTFTEVMGTPFVKVAEGSVAIGDVNGDTHPDILITGYSLDGSTLVYNAKLYTNDGSANFTEAMGTPFEGVGEGSVAMVDLNGDGPLDILITGENISDVGITRFYSNDGNGVFTEVTNTGLANVGQSAIAVADVNNDNQPDLLISGWDDSQDEPITQLYTNDGSGNFSELMDTPFTGVHFSAVAIADVNGDNQLDVMITGSSLPNNENLTKLYLNTSTTSIEETLTQSGQSTKFFPNPTRNILNIQLESKKRANVNLQIFDLSGQMIQASQQQLVGGLQTLSMDVQSLSAGMYMISVQVGNERYSEKFIKVE